MGGAGAEEEALGDRVHRGVPRLLVDRLRLLGHERAAGRVHQGVEPAERRLGRGDEARRAGGAGGVALDQGGAAGAPAAISAATCCVGRARARARGDGHGGAVAGQVERDGAAEAAHAADHEHSGAGDLHAGSPRCSYSTAAISAIAASARALARWSRPFQNTTMTIGAPAGV